MSKKGSVKQPVIKEAKQNILRQDLRVGKIIYPKRWQDLIYMTLIVLMPLLFVMGPNRGDIKYFYALIASGIMLFISMVISHRRLVCLVDGYIGYRKHGSYEKINCLRIKTILTSRSKLGYALNYGHIFVVTKQDKVIDLGKVNDINAIRAHWFRWGYEEVK